MKTMKRCGLVAALLLSLGGNALAEPRVWTSGKHTVTAEFASLNDGFVALRKPDGKIIRIPYEKLSENDQKVVTELAGRLAGDGEANRDRLAHIIEALKEHLDKTQKELSQLKVQNAELLAMVDNEKAKNRSLERTIAELKQK